jgi:hypothetical protein
VHTLSNEEYRVPLDPAASPSHGSTCLDTGDTGHLLLPDIGQPLCKGLQASSPVHIISTLCTHRVPYLLVLLCFTRLGV